MTINPVGAELCRADRRTDGRTDGQTDGRTDGHGDMAKLIVTIRIY